MFFLLHSVKNIARSLTCHFERLDVTDPAESYSLLLLGFKIVGKRGQAASTPCVVTLPSRYSQPCEVLVGVTSGSALRFVQFPLFRVLSIPGWL